MIWRPFQIIFFYIFAKIIIRYFPSPALPQEQFLWAGLKSEVIMAGKRGWKAENYYEEAMKREVKKH